MKQDFVTLPREVVDRAIAVIDAEDPYRAAEVLRAALDQPQNHVPEAGNMASAGWKLVPVEPTREMIEAGKDAHYEAEKRIQEPGAWEQGGFAKRAVRAAHVFQAMLAAAPQPPTVKECLTVEQPQANQPAMTPIAQRKLDSLLAEGYTISGYSVYHERKHQHGFVTGAGLVGWWRPEGVEYPQPKGEQEPIFWYRPRIDGLYEGPLHKSQIERVRKESGGWVPLYTNQLPKRQPLPDHYINGMFSAASLAEGDMFRRFARAIEAAHNIK